MAKNNIQENLKKYFYSGVGLAAHTAEAVQKSLKDLAKKGKVSESDGKRIVKDAIKKIEAKRPEIEAKYNSAVHQFIKTTSTEMAKLQKQIEKLEGQLRIKHSKSAKPAAAKTVAKKKTVRKTRPTRKTTSKTATMVETTIDNATAPETTSTES